jgi:hypothetical protein
MIRLLSSGRNEDYAKRQIQSLIVNYINVRDSKILQAARILFPDQENIPLIKIINKNSILGPMIKAVP